MVWNMYYAYWNQIYSPSRILIWKRMYLLNQSKQHLIISTETVLEVQKKSALSVNQDKIWYEISSRSVNKEWLTGILAAYCWKT